ncbi:MAG: hypothetical protein RL328_2013 [Acidobacteriota bacterium]|jgi:uncharacterized protein (TIGR03437 family)
MKLARFLLMLATLPAAFAQVEWDTTGNALLKGTYNFREALWISGQQASNTLDEAASQSGTITFDGQGIYTASITVYSSVPAYSGSYTRQGEYAISASGFGFIKRPAGDGGDVYGSVSNGVFIGSSTESGYNNLWVGALKPTTNVTTATFNQGYTVAYANLATPNLAQVRDALFQINPNGAGSLGTVSVTGYSGGNYTAQTQTISAASYSFTSGAGTLNLGAANSANLVSGSLQLFVSPNGQFIFGGSTNGWDLFVGVRRPSAFDPSLYNGLFHQAGLEVKRSALPAGTAGLDSFFGAFNTIASLRQLIGHQRVQTAPDSAYDFTYSDGYSLDPAGSHTDFLGYQGFLSADGSFRIGLGQGNYLGLNVAVKAPAFVSSGTAPYINPTGVVNAASFTPFTTGLAPGELITIFGTNLSTATTVDTTFPTTLGGVTVTINGKLAPIYVVSPTQLSAIVPYETATGVAEIRVSRNGTLSNRVTVFVNRTAPGVFAVPPTGLGYAAALHPDYSLVTPQNPARPAETVAVYLTGLGAVNPTVPNGSAGPVSPLAQTVESLDVRIGGQSAKIAFSGLAPLLRGLYQLNITIPATVTSGDQYLEIGGPDTLNSQILLPIAGGSRGAQATPERGRR